jgi:hypothetical protein
MQQDDTLVRMAAASAPRTFSLAEPPRREVIVKVVVAVVGFLLALPVLLLVGLALGPVALVILFISGIALVTVGLVWMLDRARTH